MALLKLLATLFLTGKLPLSKFYPMGNANSNHSKGLKRLFERGKLALGHEYVLC